MNRAAFVALLETMAEGWRQRDYAKTARCFAEDVRYGDPTRYSHRGREALLRFFENDGGLPQTIEWHHVVFDEATQTGAAEYTYEGHHRYHGLVLVKLEADLVSHWREYQHVSPLDWEDFTKETRF
jgi:SnoaL-like domain